MILLLPYDIHQSVRPNPCAEPLPIHPCLQPLPLSALLPSSATDLPRTANQPVPHSRSFSSTGSTPIPQVDCSRLLELSMEHDSLQLPRAPWTLVGLTSGPAATSMLLILVTVPATHFPKAIFHPLPVRTPHPSVHNQRFPSPSFPFLPSVYPSPPAPSGRSDFADRSGRLPAVCIPDTLSLIKVGRG